MIRNTGIVPSSLSGGLSTGLSGIPGSMAGIGTGLNTLGTGLSGLSTGLSGISSGISSFGSTIPSTSSFGTTVPSAGLGGYGGITSPVGGFSSPTVGMGGLGVSSFSGVPNVGYSSPISPTVGGFSSPTLGMGGIGVASTLPSNITSGFQGSSGYGSTFTNPRRRFGGPLSGGRRHFFRRWRNASPVVGGPVAHSPMFYGAGYGGAPRLSLWQRMRYRLGWGGYGY